MSLKIVPERELAALIIIQAYDLVMDFAADLRISTQ
jgi:hypothetical protein